MLLILACDRFDLANEFQSGLAIASGKWAGKGYAGYAVFFD